MISVCLLVLTGAAAFAFYTYVGYPLLLMGLAVVRRRRSPVVPLAEWPRVTVVLPVHNEEAVIRGTLENLLELDYPPDRRHILVVSDASTDRTDAIVKEYAGRGVELLRLPSRRGKTGAENAALPLLGGEIVVNTDASVRVERGALRPLIASFADPSVGVASNRNVSVAPGTYHPNYAESWYVGYEMRVRDLESQVSGIVGAAGCLYAARLPIQKQLLPEGLCRDFAAGLIAWELGWRAVSVPEAICFVPRLSSLRQEYRRKVRTMTRGMDTLRFKRALLNGFRYGLFSWILASHKVCRWLLPPVGVLALVALMCLAPSAPPARWGLGLAGVVGLCAALAWWWPARWPLPMLLAVPAYLVMGNVAVLHAFVRVVRGDGAPTWEPTRRGVGGPATVG